MMEEIRNITIREGEVLNNGVPVFTHEEREVSAFLKQVYKHYGIAYPKFYKMSPLSKLGFMAAELLLQDEDLSGTDPSMVSLVLANASSSLHTDAVYQETIGSKPSPALFVYTLPNIVIGEICIRHGFKGEGVFYIQEQFESAFIRSHVSQLFESDSCSVCLAGWVEVGPGGDYLADLCLFK